jgi:hypothetical protein
MKNPGILFFLLLLLSSLRQGSPRRGWTGKKEENEEYYFSFFFCFLPFCEKVRVAAGPARRKKMKNIIFPSSSAFFPSARESASRLDRQEGRK